MVQNLGFIVTFFDVLGHMFDCTIYPQTAEQAPLSSLRIKMPYFRHFFWCITYFKNESTAPQFAIPTSGTRMTVWVPGRAL